MTFKSVEDEFKYLREEKIAIDTLERYSNSSVEDFQPLILLTNFGKYVEYFAESRNVEMIVGPMFEVAHSPEEQITFLNFKLGTAAAALAVDLCSHLPIKLCIMLGMCGGLRSEYSVGNYFLPVGAIRAEGTSDFYFPPEVPAMANFFLQNKITSVLEETDTDYHVGIVYTMNKRFWEFNKRFRKHLQVTRPQAIEMECATLFAAAYYHKLPLGALLLISDLPLAFGGIKTKESSRDVFSSFTKDHVEKGVQSLKAAVGSLDSGGKGKGAARGKVKHMETPLDGTIYSDDQ
jgi:AMP nucleosidase